MTDEKTAEPPEPDKSKEISTQSADKLAALQPRVVESEEILKGADEIQIVHLDNIYRLRRTRNGKLILQK